MVQFKWVSGVCIAFFAATVWAAPTKSQQQAKDKLVKLLKSPEMKSYHQNLKGKDVQALRAEIAKQSSISAATCSAGLAATGATVAGGLTLTVGATALGMFGGAMTSVAALAGGAVATGAATGWVYEKLVREGSPCQKASARAAIAYRTLQVKTKGAKKAPSGRAAAFEVPATFAALAEH